MASSKNNRKKRVTGKIGSTVAYELYGEEVVRSIGVRNAPFTPNEIAAQRRTKVTQHFINIIYPFICVGFENEARLRRQNPQNVSFSYNRKYAVTGNYPDISVAFSKVLVSMGTLNPPLNPVAVPETGGVRFTWEYDALASNQHWSDQIMMLVFLPEINDAVYVMAGVTRNIQTTLIEIPSYLEYTRMETYLSIISADRRKISNSIYTGSLTL